MRVPKNILISITVASALAGMTSGANADLVISKKPTSNMNCSAGVCNATAADAVLNVKDLTNMLAASDVHVFAEGVATDITVADAFGWASSHQLTLGAYDSLNVKAAISITGTSGLTIVTNVAGTGGIFRFVGVGKISFWDTNSTLVINNTTYTLINNLPALIAAIAANPSGTYAFANDYNAAQDGSYLASPIPTPLSGTVEGLGNAINNVTIYNSNDTSHQFALFLEVANGGVISDLNLGSVSITGGSFSAALTVENAGTINHASASGAITTNQAGGLVVQNDGLISRSQASVAISGTFGGGLALANNGGIVQSHATPTILVSGNAGGLVAVSSGTITDSYALGKVQSGANFAGAQVGGLVGNSSGSILRCFATDNVYVGDLGPQKKMFAVPRNGRRRGPGADIGGLVGISSGSIAYSYAMGNVLVGQVDGSRTHHPSVGGLVGQSAAGNSNIVQAYAIGLLSFDGGKYLGGALGSDYSASGSNNAVLWDLDTTGVRNPEQGAGNVFDDKGLKGLHNKQFKGGGALNKLDITAWAQNPEINHGYPYLLGNPPPN